MPSHSQRPPQQKKPGGIWHGTDPTGPLGVTTPGVKTHEKPAESHGNRTMTAVPNRAPVSVQDLAAALSHSVDEPERPQLSRRERRERDRNAKKAEEREEKAYRRENAVSLHERAELQERGIDWAKDKAKDGGKSLLKNALVEDGIPEGAIDAAESVKGHVDVVREAWRDNKALGASDVKSWLGGSTAGQEAGAAAGRSVKGSHLPTGASGTKGFLDGASRGIGAIGGELDILESLFPTGTYQEQEEKRADINGRSSKFLGGALDVAGALCPNIPSPVMWAAQSGLAVGKYGNEEAKKHGVFTDSRGENIGADDYMANAAQRAETWTQGMLGDGWLGRFFSKAAGVGGFAASALPALGGTLVGAATGLGEDTADAVNSWRGVRMPASTGHTASDEPERAQARDILNQHQVPFTQANMQKVTFGSHDEVLEHANEVEILEDHQGRGSVSTDHIAYGTSEWLERQRLADARWEADRLAAQRRHDAPGLRFANGQQREIDILIAKQQGRYNSRTGKVETEQEHQDETLRLIHSLHPGPH